MNFSLLVSLRAQDINQETRSPITSIKRYCEREIHNTHTSNSRLAEIYFHQYAPYMIFIMKFL